MENKMEESAKEFIEYFLAGDIDRMELTNQLINFLMKPDEFRHVSDEKYVAIYDSGRRDEMVDKLTKSLDKMAELRKKLLFKIQLDNLRNVK